jgi:hypothetical protein
MAIAVLAPGLALAQEAPAERMNRQQARINQGAASGALTHHEAAVDEHHLRTDERIRAQQRAHDHGAPLTAAQRSRDERLLNNNSARVYDTKHNGRTAPPQR